MKLPLFSVIIIILVIDCFAQSPMHFPARYELEEWQDISESKIWKSFYPEEDENYLSKIVSINNGDCTGFLISEDGHIMTNYHCLLQNLYHLTDKQISEGFYASNSSEEIKLEGLEIEIPISYKRLKKLESLIDDKFKLDSVISSRLDSLNQSENKRFIIKRFLPQNEYFLIEYEIYSDISIVCIPPEKIANYGGNKANWHWPRHALDFSILKVNSDREFDFFKTGKAVKSDRVFSLGFPASTKRTASSYAMEYKASFENKIRLQMRKERIHLLEESENLGKSLNPALKAELQDLNNFTQFLEGESELIRFHNYIEGKKVAESQMAKTSVELNELLTEMYSSYERLKVYAKYRLFLNEALLVPKIFLFSFKFNALAEQLNAEEIPENLDVTLRKLRASSESFFEFYEEDIDKKLFSKMLEYYDLSIPDSLKNETFLKSINNFNKEYFEYTRVIYDSSIFSSKARMDAFLKEPNLETLENDPAFDHSRIMVEHYFSYIAPKLNGLKAQIEAMESEYNALSDYNFTEANSTLRISEGFIEGYKPIEALNYEAFTSFQEYLKLDDSKMVSIAKEMESQNLCFIASMDVSAGNSGSPVINENGELVGIVFDQNQEGMANQYVYDPKIQRAICADIQAIKSFVSQYFGKDSMLK